MAEKIESGGLTEEADLPTKPKGDKQKVELAGSLRGETTVALKWIAQLLTMGSWTNVSNLLASESRAKRK